MNNSPTYYDYTDLTLDEWLETLRESEVNNYKFIGTNKAYKELDGKVYLKEYSNGQVLTYELNTNL